MLGRLDTVRQVTAILDGNRSVIVSGPAGIGKTTLMDAVLRPRPHAAGAAVAGLRWRPFFPLMRAVGQRLDGDVETVASTVSVALDHRVLFVDDLHWADPATVDVLGLLVDRVPVVMTCRPKLEPTAWADRVELVEVAPLSTALSRRLARRLHPELATADMDRLLTAAAGNPLLIENLARDGVTTPTLRAAMGSRLQDLDGTVRDAIAELAAFGRPIALDLLDVTAPELPAGLVEVTGGEVFLHHPLLGDAALESLNASERADVHLRLAGRLPPADAAEHFLVGGDRDAAHRCANAALDDADDPALRAHLLSIAADASGDDALRNQAAAALVKAGDWLGGRRLAAEVLSDDPLVAAEAALHLSRACWFAGDVGAARTAAEMGIATLGDRDHPLVARLSVELAHQRVRTEEVAGSTSEVARTALAVAERLGTDVPRARNVLATALAHDGLPGWEDAYRAVLPEAAAVGDTETECSAAYYLASQLGFAGRLPEAIDLLETMIERATGLGEVTWRDHMTAAAITDRFMLGGDPDRVACDAQRFVHERPLFRNRAQAELALALSLADQGRSDDAGAALDRAMADLTGDEDRSILLAAATEVAWMEGDVPRTVELAEEAAALGPGWFGITAGTVATAAVARFELAEAVMVELAPAKVPIFASFPVEVEALRTFAEGHPGRAIELLDAVTDRPGIPRRYQVRAQWVAAVMAARSDRPDTPCRFQAVHRLAVAVGLAPLATRAAAALRSFDRPATLTDRETAVLRLVQEGLTSNEIAARLGIARATVESHIGSAMRKLGARTRRQAALMIQ